jgi:ABC-type antimicrobial peptide transport system permease subunit
MIGEVNSIPGIAAVESFLVKRFLAVTLGLYSINPCLAVIILGLLLLIAGQAKGIQSRSCPKIITTALSLPSRVCKRMKG